MPVEATSHRRPVARSASIRTTLRAYALASMATRTSAGILLYRRTPRGLEVLLAHPGGPIMAAKDEGHWSIPKGELDGDDPERAARREFEEETGLSVADATLVDLGSTRQKGGKLVLAWGAEGDLDPARAVSNTFVMEWPPRSGRTQEFPEIDRVAWFSLDEARRRLKEAQAVFLDRLAGLLGEPAVDLSEASAPAGPSG